MCPVTEAEYVPENWFQIFRVGRKPTAASLPGPWPDERVESVLAFFDEWRTPIDRWDPRDQARMHWAFIGSYLRTGREEERLSMRAAATRAGISDSLWRHLEAGERWIHGDLVFPNSSDRNLIAAAHAVYLDPRVILRTLGRPYHHLPRIGGPEDTLAPKLQRLNPRDRQIIERMIDSMLDEA
jgi:hypothetical protein